MNGVEYRYVNQVYESIHSEFNHTRQYPWPVVKEFINVLPKYSALCDVGSGNGKNMFRHDLVNVSTDFSYEMCKLSQSRSDSIQSNVLSLPFQDNTFDAVICIACIHHLSTEKRRKKAIDECKRILKTDGKMLISVWSNSEKYGSGDQFIRWNKHHEKRYYHLFNRQELQSLCNFDCKIFYNHYNYYVQI